MPVLMFIDKLEHPYHEAHLKATLINDIITLHFNAVQRWFGGLLSLDNAKTPKY